VRRNFRVGRSLDVERLVVFAGAITQDLSNRLSARFLEDSESLRRNIAPATLLLPGPLVPASTKVQERRIALATRARRSDRSLP
jgi:hypothetical protein